MNSHEGIRRSAPSGVGFRTELSAEAQEATPAHIPVLLEETLSFFQPENDVRLLDGTLGLGGHTEGLLRKVIASGCQGCRLLALDRDEMALESAKQRLAPYREMFYAAHGCFADLPEIIGLYERGMWPAFDFALIDVGVSSMQLDTPERGFSFIHDGPLDMRMDAGAGQSASEIVNRASLPQLKEIIFTLGEDPLAAKIARCIVEERVRQPIETTGRLAQVVERAYPAKWRAKARNHPATRTFQALRMAVNDELGQLQRFLETIVPLLAPGGRVAVITFHSLEDRIVKHFFREQARQCLCPPHIAVCSCGHEPALLVLTRKAVTPSKEEEAGNPRSSSAKLRVAEKVGTNG